MTEPGECGVVASMFDKHYGPSAVADLQALHFDGEVAILLFQEAIN
jgi:hypothetical protein